MNFSEWFLTQFLLGRGWPRKQGLLRRRQVVSAQAVDDVLDQLSLFGCGLGTGLPELAARVLAKGPAFGRDWKGQGATDPLGLLDQAAEMVRSEDELADLPPWIVLARITAPRTSDLARRLGRGDEIDMERIYDSRLRVQQEALWVTSIYFGLMHPGDVRGFVEAERDWPDADALFRDCESLIAGYVAATEPLPAVPPQLREALAVRLGDPI